ncbi:MAG: hypothetical protein R3Y09_12350 [Clostridia bacterium]
MNKANDEHSLSCLSEALSSFKCDLDSDIETFLHTKAIEFLENGLCSTYLILDEEKFEKGEIFIEAYFTLSHKTMIRPECVSGSKIQKVSRFRKSTSLHFVLIGQLGKYISVKNDVEIVKSEISINEILEYAFEVISESSALIPCRCVLVECHDAVKDKCIYEKSGFTYFQQDEDLHQYYKLL